jgi:hypothetical protein
MTASQKAAIGMGMTSSWPRSRCRTASWQPSLRPNSVARRDPAAHPYVAAGSSRKTIAWETLVAAGRVVGLKTSVDTSSAGFGGTPQYLAHVVGDRRLAGSGDVLDGLVNLSEASPVSFLLSVNMPPDVPLGGGLALNPSKYMNAQLPDLVSEQLGWSITWLGIEG